MKKYYPFLQTYFFALGVVWFLCGSGILIFRATFNEAEIILTLVLPLAYAIVEEVKRNKNSNPEQRAENG